jgi:imidazolonepropionase-like amidohydrolase
MSLLLAGATVIDGTGKDPLATTVHVEDDRISGLGGPDGSPERVLDLTGLTVLPGLIDAHVHVGFSSDVRASLSGELSVAERAADIFRNLNETLQAGFTTVRDTGGIDLGVVRTVERGLAPGPRILACGPGLCQCGGHGHLHSPFEPADAIYRHDVLGLTALGRYCDGPDDVRRAAREAFRRGATFLKLSVTGGVISMSDALADTQFTSEEIAVAVQEAKARSTYVTVHAHNPVGVRVAVKAGVGCVEHGTDIDEETATLMAEHGVNLVPTLAIARVLVEDFGKQGLPANVQDRLVGTEKGMRDGLLAARAAGVLVGSGSDLIGPDQNRRGLEIALKAEVIGAMQAIVSATSVNAKIIGLKDVGTVAAGKYADLVAVDFDPLERPDLFDDPNRVVLVIKNGQVVKDTRS